MRRFTYLIIVLLLTSLLIIDNSAIAQDIDQSNETIIYALPYDFDEYSIYTADSYATAQWNGAVYASLIKRSYVNLGWEPDLASSMPNISADGLTYVFTLKDNLRFSNGHELTASDVEFSFHAALSPAVNQAFYGSFIEFLDNDSITVVNSKSIEITFLKPFTFSYQLLSFPIVDEQFFEKRYNRCLNGVEDDCVWNNVNGTDVVSAGPFMVEDIDNVHEIVTTIANPYYYDAENIFTDKIIFQKVADKDTAISALASGTIDILDSQYVPGLNELSNIEGIWEDFIGDPSSQQYSLNHLNPYFGTGEAIPGNEAATEEEKYEDALLIRKAMSHIVDRDFAVNEILEGLARPAATIMPEASIGFDETLVPREFSIEIARNYMEAAGFDYDDLGEYAEASTTTRAGFERNFFEITMLSPNTGGVARNQWHADYVLELPKIGIGVKQHVSTGWGEIAPRTFSATDLPGSYEEGGFDIFAVGYGWALDWNPSTGYSSAGNCATGDCNNFLNFDLGEDMTNLATLVLDYQGELDFDRRIDKVKLIQAEIYKWIPELPILYPRSHWGFNEQISGIDTLLLSSSAQDWARVRKDGFFTNIPTFSISKDSLEFPVDMRIFFGSIGVVGLITYGIYYKYRKRKIISNNSDSQLL